MLRIGQKFYWKWRYKFGHLASSSCWYASTIKELVNGVSISIILESPSWFTNSLFKKDYLKDTVEVHTDPFNVNSFRTELIIY